MGCPVVHFEIGCKSTPETAKFYTTLFGWTTSQHGPAAMIDTGAKEGINGHINALGHEPHNYTVVYAQVEDLQAYIDKATSLGGKMMVPPMEVPGMGHFAWITDPEGTVVGLWKPKQ